MNTYGFLSVLPPVIGILLAIATRRVLPSLFLSIWFGATIICRGNLFRGFAVTMHDYIAGSFADPWNATILTVCLSLGGMIGIISRSGGITAIADSISARVRTPRGGQLATALMGFVIFFDDYANALLVGNTMRPLTDRLNISREKLAYIVDSTAAPVASMALVSTWVTYQLGIIRSVFSANGIEMNSYEAFLRTLPFRYYSILCLVFVGAVLVLGRDFGSMYAAEVRARTTGRLTGPNANPLLPDRITLMALNVDVQRRWYNAVIPLCSVVCVLVIGLLVTGSSGLQSPAGTHVFPRAAIRDIIGHADGAVSMLWAVAAGSLVAILLTVGTKTLSLKESVESWIEGAQSIFTAAVILVMAWGIGNVCRDLGTASYIVGLLEGTFPPALVPATTFVIGCTVAFATGTAYGTIAILMPVVVPLVYKLSGGAVDSLLFATMGAVFTGAVFGDHCSPLSDTTIMSSMASASDHIDHVKTQAPYALTVAAIAVAAGFLPAGLLVQPAVSIPAGAVLVLVVVRYAGKKVDTPPMPNGRDAG